MPDIYHTSYLRANIVAWLPIHAEDKVLYIGHAEDVTAKKLMEMSDHVDCAEDLTEHTACEGSYDYAVCIGTASLAAIPVFYAQLNEHGKLIFAAENAYGLKYLSGVREVHSNEYFAGIENTSQSLGCTKEELEAAVKEAGFTWQQTYYPFPDHIFAMSIYSDDYLPKQGELIDQIGNFDSDRLVLFDEAKAADAAIARGKFKEFSNAYLAVCGKKEAEAVVNQQNERIAFVKFSNDRGTIHNIRTYITRSEDGRMHLWKVPDTKEADGQILNLKKTEEALTRLYADSLFSMNTCMQQSDGMELAFLMGHTLEEELDTLLDKGEPQAAVERMFEVIGEIRSCKEIQAFQMTEEFEKVFGSITLPEGLSAVPVGDIDMIMPNILVDEEGRWTVIDYEWSFHFPIPVNYIVYRAIHYYADTTAKRKELLSFGLYERAGITEEEKVLYAEMEEAFQRYVLDGHVPMRQLYREYGKPAYHVSSVLNVVDDMERKRMLQVYFDRGSGTNEADCINYHSKSLDGYYCLEIPVDQDVAAVRIDPGSQACTVEVKTLCWKDKTTSKEKTLEFYGPAHKFKEHMYLYDTDDPYMLITAFPEGERILKLECRVDAISLAAAEILAPKIDTKYRIKKMLNK